MYVSIEATTIRASTVTQADTGDRHQHPCVDHDAFVEHAVEHVDQARGP